MTATIDPVRRAYRPEEAADLLGISTSSVRRMLWSGRLRHIRVGRAIVIPDYVIEEFLATAESKPVQR